MTSQRVMRYHALRVKKNRSGVAMRIKQRKFEASDRKLKELILYVALKSQQDPNFGATKLNKILFYADFNAYVRLGKSITGQDYQALAQGPAPRRMLPLCEQMESAKDIALQEAPRASYTQKRTIALRDPDLSHFSAKQIALVDDVILELWLGTAQVVSDLSHEFLGWKLAEEGETIPYDVALLSNQADLTPSEIKKGKALEKIARDWLAS